MSTRPEERKSERASERKGKRGKPGLTACG
jgi:hypothetical protein